MGASPLPRRSHTNPGLEILRRGNGDAPSTLPGSHDGSGSYNAAFARELLAGKSESDWQNALVMNKTGSVLVAGMWKNEIAIA